MIVPIYLSGCLVGLPPPERNIRKIAAQIASCVMTESDEANLSSLCEEYAVDISILEKTIVERLLSAYENDTTKAEKIKYETISLLLPIMKDISWQGETVIVADFFRWNMKAVSF